MNLCFIVNGVPMQAEVFVTDRVEDFSSSVQLHMVFC
jgi:hypothetical protein